MRVWSGLLFSKVNRSVAVNMVFTSDVYSDVYMDWKSSRVSRQQPIQYLRKCPFSTEVRCSEMEVAC